MQTMNIYTRTGDAGQTGLIGGERRFKDDRRVEAYGSVDEAGAFIGLARSVLDRDICGDIDEVLEDVQQTLWDVGADLGATGERYVYRTPEDAAARLEPLIDRYRDAAPALRRFVLRGGSPAAAYVHVACTVVRRAERRTTSLMRAETVHMPAYRYLNRVSDLLFVLARALNARSGQCDVEYRNSPQVFRA
jgi:cob(I)alamin adenosyltransferase